MDNTKFICSRCGRTILTPYIKKKNINGVVYYQCPLCLKVPMMVFAAV